MSNHPGRPSREGWTLQPITPPELAALLKRADIKPPEAARRCNASIRSMGQWLAKPGTSGHRRMPLAASELLALSLAWPGESRVLQPDVDFVQRWIRPQFAGLILSL